MSLAASLRDKTLMRDLALRVPLAAWFGWHGGAFAVALARWAWSRDLWALRTPVLINFTAGVLQALFMLSVAAVVLIRHRPTFSPPGLYPRLLAIGSTFFLAVLPTLPSRAPSELLDLIAAALMLSGWVVSVLGLLWLGRSFSLVPEARRLVTTGPYRWVRHPLYVAEFILTAGFALQFQPWPAWTLFALTSAMQLERIRLEERVLRNAFPEYSAYARRTPMLLPWFRKRVAGALVRDSRDPPSQGDLSAGSPLAGRAAPVETGEFVATCRGPVDETGMLDRRGPGSL